MNDLSDAPNTARPVVQDYIDGLLDVSKRFQSSPPIQVWHYTSFETLKLILNSQSLRFTHVSNFHDKTEVQTALEITQSVLDYRMGSMLDAREKTLLQLAKSQMLKKSADSGWYASSLTDSQDDPHLWKHFADDFQGVSIGFNFLELIRYLSPSPSSRLYPAQILYDLKRSYEFAGCIIEHGVHYFKRDFSLIANDTDAANNFLQLYGKLADPFSVIVKKHKFQDEKEWRLARHITSATDGDAPSTLADGRKVWLTKRGKFSDSTSEALPVLNVIVGNRCQVSIEAIRCLLDNVGLSSAKVSLSQVVPLI